MEKIEELRQERDAAALLLQEATERLEAAEAAARPQVAEQEAATAVPSRVPRNKRERQAARLAKIAAQDAPSAAAATVKHEEGEATDGA